MSIPHGVDAVGHYHPILVDTSGRPLIILDAVTGTILTVTPNAGAEWTVTPKAGATFTPVQTTPGSLTVGDHGYDGTAWRKQGLMWAYKDRYFQIVADADADAGNNNLVGSTVPAGEVWVIENFHTINTSHGCGIIWFFANLGGSDLLVWQVASLAVWVYGIWNGHITLKAGDHVHCYLQGITLHDSINFAVGGYKMGVAM